MVIDFTIVESQLSRLVIVNVTLYVPARAKLCVGFWSVEKLLAPEVGSPKSQLQEMIGLPPFVCDISVKSTLSPAQVAVEWVKSAMGEGTLFTVCSMK